MTLCAVVIGTGWAGEGHTIALRAAGVEVVAICGRSPEPARAMAARLNIPDVRFDWRQALETLHPDIISIATTAAPHREMVELAARLGCHIMCDKPLGVNAADGRAMLLAVEQAGVKHAYGSTNRYAPTCRYAQQLVTAGSIGALREVESMLHVNFPPGLPYSWFYSLAMGGGMLNTMFTHKMGQVTAITGGKVTSVMGEAQRLLERAPLGAPIHDIRTLFAQTVTPDATTEWHAVDADLAYTVLAQMTMPDGKLVSTLFKGSAMSSCRNRDYLAFYGERGTLHLSNVDGQDQIEHFDHALGEWRVLSLPQEIRASLPQVDDSVQRDWNQLFCEFVADIRAEGGVSAEPGYPTFHEGWQHNEIIDSVRSSGAWSAIPAQIS